MTKQVPRPLTEGESAALVRKLIIALGASGKDAALRAIAECGVGIFALDEPSS